MARYKQLPEPDEFGSYWFGRRALGETKQHEPVIFPSKSVKDEQVVFNGNYFVNMGDKVLFEGNQLKRFKTPQEAMFEINSRLQGDCHEPVRSRTA